MIKLDRFHAVSVHDQFVSLNVQLSSSGELTHCIDEIR